MQGEKGWGNFCRNGPDGASLDFWGLAALDPRHPSLLSPFFNGLPRVLLGLGDEPFEFLNVLGAQRAVLHEVGH